MHTDPNRGHPPVTTHPPLHHPIVITLATVVLGAALAGCLGNDAAAQDDAGRTPSGDPDAPQAMTQEVVGVDYGFTGLPDEPLAAGTELEFRNDSDVEFHEMVVLRLADDEDRTVDELLELPDDEAMSAMAFVGVAVAGPGQAGEVVDGDVTLADPGRYVLTCFIPQGADPDVVAEAMGGASEGPPDLGDGMPHAFAGMVREVVVE